MSNIRYFYSNGNDVVLVNAIVGSLIMTYIDGVAEEDEYIQQFRHRFRWLGTLVIWMADTVPATGAVSLL